MEYVAVKYPHAREVRIDGQLAGQTNDLLMVERGHHQFDLGEPLDYQPASMEVNVQDTTAIRPLIIGSFQAIGDSQ